MELRDLEAEHVKTVSRHSSWNGGPGYSECLDTLSRYGFYIYIRWDYPLQGEVKKGAEAWMKIKRS